jgi:tetratricopeptide (TPR) repeat protein
MSPVGYGLLLVLPARGTATDQAAQAASCALDLHRLRPELRIAVATGRAEMTHRLPVGPAIDRAASAIRATGIAVSEVRVAVDEMTAGLLGPRFDVHVEDGAHWVLGERDDLEVPRLLLGRPTPCVGRDAELAHLDAVLQECIADREPRAVLVTAPPGTGKTRLASEFLTRVRARGSVRCLLARGDAVAAGSSLALAQKLIRQAVGLRETDAPELQLERLRAHLASKVHPSSLDRLTELLGEITGASGPRSAPMIRTPRNDPSVALAQKQAFDEWIEVETREPLLIVLEDLQWGDVPSVTYLQEAMRRQTNRPLMVLALGRPEVCEQFPQLWDDLAGAQVLREIRLGGLAPRAAGRLVRAVLGDEVSPETTTRIIERSVGNAFYLEELIRHVAKGETELPETVLAMAEIRLDGLEPEARRVLRAASIFGEACWSGGVAALLGPTIQTAEWLEALADRELLVRTVESRFPEEREYACRHSLLRDAIHVTLTNYDRKVAHRLAATWLESMGERNASVLAHHFQEAGEADLAAKYHLRAGDMATRLCSFGEARAHYDASLASLALRQIYATLLADTAEQNLTRAEEARALLDEIAARGELSSDDRLRLARVYYCFGRIHLLFRADPSRAMEYYRKVLPAGKEAGDDDLIGLPSSLIGTALTIQGKAREAEPLLAQAIEPLERLGDPFEWSRAVGFHGLCLILMGRYAEGVSQLDRILANAEQVRQANLLSATHLMAGTAYLLAGDWPAAHSLLRDAVGYATETGDKLYLYLIWSSLGWTRSFLGEHDEARAARATARGIADGMGGRLLIDDWYRAGDAEIAFNAGDVEAAWKLATSVVESSGAAGLLVSQGIAQRVLSDVLALRGCHDDADAHIGQSIVTFESGGLHMQAARSRLHWAWQHRRRNNWGEAEHLYAAARAQFDRFGCVYAMADTTRRWATT